MGALDQIIDVGQETLFGFIPIKGVMDLFDIPPKQRKLSLHRVRHFPTIRRCHASPRVHS
jgi:hypothetical protein